MTAKKTLASVAAAAALAVSWPVYAQSSPALDEMRDEVRRLREEVRQLRGAQASTPAGASDWGARLDRLEQGQKDAVTQGELPGSMRLPGSGTSLRLYGFAEVHAIHDLKQSGPSDVFSDLMFQPLDSAGGKTGKTTFTAQTSRFGLATSTPVGTETLATKLEGDFYAYGSGNRNRLRLRHAYAQYGNWLVGQTWSTFMDLDDMPETVDFNAIGGPSSRRVQLRYTYDKSPIAKFTVALEDPEDQFGAGSSHERLPQLIARADKQFDWGGLSFRLLSHEKRSATQSKRGLGVGIGGHYKLSEKDVVMAQYAQVDGDIDHMVGGSGYVIDSATGAIRFGKSQGLIVGYTHTFSPELRGTVMYGMNHNKTAAALDNRKLQEWHLNLIYTPMKNVEIGAEYIHGVRKTFAKDKGTMSRFDLMARYTF